MSLNELKLIVARPSEGELTAPSVIICCVSVCNGTFDWIVSWALLHPVIYGLAT